MLNQPKVLQELQKHVDKLFIDLSPEFDLAKKVWASIICDPLFAQKVSATHAPWLLPSWVGNLSDVDAHTPHTNLAYQVIGIDGSQIYPDKHQGTSCCLINIGSVALSYGSHNNVFLESKPFVYFNDDLQEVDNSAELINCRRQELEFNEALTLAKKYHQTTSTTPLLVLFDGSLIFWHLEGKEQTIKDTFVHNYVNALQQFYELQIPIVGYISLPKSKELVNLIRLKMSDFNPNANQNHKAIQHLVDTHVASFYLNTFERTTFFASKSPIVAYYPAHLKPYFFYLRLEDEIVRIEMPAWLLTQPQTIDSTIAIIIDQTKKGRGYPVCLAEAHEQAVVKGPDRDFFYHMIQKIGYNNKQHLTISQKSLKKRGIGI